MTARVAGTAFLFLAMTAALVYGFALGDGWAEVRELTAYPWFNVSLVDVYVGFIFFSAWVVRRERKPLVAVLWIIAIMTLGNWASCLYVFVALAQSRGDARRFWMGETPSRA